MEKARGRRRRVPAFGEWNYYYNSDQLSTPALAAATEWYAPAQGTAETCSDVWFKYSPPSRKPPPPPPRRKARRPENSGGKRRVQAATPARASDASAPKAAARAPAKAPTARVVRSVDADLYQVPPLEFESDEPRPTYAHEPRRKIASRSSWMACLLFSCCVT